VIALAVLLLQTAAAELEPVITEMHATTEAPSPPKRQARIHGPYTLIPVKPGINPVPRFGPSGEGAVIVSAWVDNGNCYGHRRIDVMIPAKDGGWNLVDIRDSRLVDGIGEMPHCRYDATESVKFFRGYENGRRVALMAKAARSPEEGEPNPAETAITIYSMRYRGKDVGTTEIYFQPVKDWPAKLLYCNAEMALRDEMGFPLSANYKGSMKRGGCFG
jgi:hypothetical protein